jgi:hypothetical protein
VVSEFNLDRKCLKLNDIQTEGPTGDVIFELDNVDESDEISLNSSMRKVATASKHLLNSEPENSE